MGKLEIYLVRHGETEWNREGRLQGWLNSRLTTLGRLNTEMLKQRFQFKKFHAIYSSSLGRAVETASILNNRDDKFLLDSRLKEIHLGKWQGRLISSIWEEDYERYFAYSHKPELYIPDGGETFQQVINRMVDFINDCIRMHHQERILVVTHAVAIRALLLNVLNLPIEAIWETGDIDGTSVTVLEVENQKIQVRTIGKKYI